MPIYTKPQIDLLTDLINEANPGLNLAPVNVENTRLGIPFARTPNPGGIGDTGVEIFPRDNSFFIGRVVVNYRRIKLENLFANKVIKFNRWRGRNLNKDDIAKWLNERYGTTFVPEDFVGTTWTSTETVREIEISSQSLCYQGTLYLQWIEGKRELDQILNTNEFSARYWSLLHKNAPEDTRPLLTLTNYGRDYTDFKRNIDRITNGSIIGANTNTNHLRVIITRYNQIGLTELDVDKPHTELYGLAGLKMTKLSIPTSSLTEANSEDYTHVLVINSEEDSWFGGRIILHYNEVLLNVNRKTMLYGEEFEFLLLDSGYDGNLVYYWQLEGGINRAGVEGGGGGQLEFSERTMFKRITIPSAAGNTLDAEFKVVIRANSYTGAVVMESDPIQMEDVMGEQRYDWVDPEIVEEPTEPPPVEYDENGEPIEPEPTPPSEPVPPESFSVEKGVWKVDLDIVAGSGGGGGSQLKTVWDENTGGHGGAGELKRLTLDVVEGDVFTWVIGAPGIPGLGGNEPTSGGEGQDTYVFKNGTLIGTANGGHGGRSGSRIEPERNNKGTDGGTTVGNEGGLGGLPDGEDGQEGVGGHILIKYRSW